MPGRFFIPIIAGTVRPNRRSIFAARLVHEIASSLPNVESMLVDPVEYPLPYDGNNPESKNPAYSELSARADGFMIVTPEYNHSIPGTLKRLLDSELENYNHKPVAFGGVSDGPWGGVRAIEALVVTVRGMGLVSCRKDVQFPMVKELFDEQGGISAENKEKYVKRVQRTYEDLLWMVEVLKAGRER